MANRRRRRRNPARYLAPLALAAAIVGVYVIVQSALHKSHATTTTQSQTTTGAVTTPHGKTHLRKYYFVKPGDNLTTIAAKTGVPLSTIQALNPNVNPTALQTGQRLLLRR